MVLENKELPKTFLSRIRLTYHSQAAQNNDNPSSTYLEVHQISLEKDKPQGKEVG